eukprot:1841123-Amphidinium_carterae.1
MKKTTASARHKAMTMHGHGAMGTLPLFYKRSQPRFEGPQTQGSRAYPSYVCVARKATATMRLIYS